MIDVAGEMDRLGRAPDGTSKGFAHKSKVGVDDLLLLLVAGASAIDTGSEGARVLAASETDLCRE